MIAPPELLEVRQGPLLLAGVDDAPGLDAHRRRVGPLPDVGLDRLLDIVTSASVRGRGGAGFPFARKLAAVADARGRMPSRRPVVVVNAAEGEPASAKDEALVRLAPHLVLDGAELAAVALGAREVHVVTSQDRSAAGRAVDEALAEREGPGPRWRRHTAEGRFVAGQSRAVLELMAGRPGLPVTAWAPATHTGHRGRPTLLSNAESWAHLAAAVLHGPEAYAALGTEDEPGTTLLTLSGPPGPGGRMGRVRVVEAEHGAPAMSVLGPAALVSPLLVGGFHGGWVHPRDVPDLTVSAHHLTRSGSRSAPGPGCRWTTGRARSPRRRATRTSSPRSPPDAAAPAATACPPSPTRSAASRRAPTPADGCASSPGSWQDGARARTPTGRPASSPRC